MRRFLTIVFLISCFHTQAQQAADIKWSEELEFSKSAEYNKIIGLRGDNLLVISSSSNNPKNSVNVSLDIYDKNSYELVKHYKICDSKSEHNFEDLIITSNYIHLFTSFYDRNLGFEILSVQTFDDDENRFSEPERIDEVFSDSKEKDIPFVMTVSPNGNYVLIYHDNPSRSGNKSFNMKVMNEDFTAVWEKEIELNYKDRMVEVRDLIIDDNSTVYLLTSINPYGISKSLGFGTLLNIKNTLFTYRPYEDKLKEFEFALTRNWINSVSMQLDENQHLLATAYYTYPNDYKMRGFVIMKLHQNTGVTIMRKMVTFDKDQYKEIENSISNLKEHSKDIIGSTGIYPGTSSHMNNTSTEFAFKEILVTSSGMVFAIEALRRDERCTESFNEQQMIVNCEKHYLYGDVLLFFMSSLGDVKRIVNVEKLQHSIDKVSPYYSYSITNNDRNLFVMFNDETSNVLSGEESELLRKKPLKTMRKASLELIVFNNEGERVKTDLNRIDEENVSFLPDAHQWLDESALLLYSQKNKNYKFGKLTLQ